MDTRVASEPVVRENLTEEGEQYLLQLSKGYILTLL